MTRVKTAASFLEHVEAVAPEDQFLVARRVTLRPVAHPVDGCFLLAVVGDGGFEAGLEEVVVP